MTKPSIPFVLYCAALALPGVQLGPAAARALDCSIFESSRKDPKLNTSNTVRASSYPAGTCIPAADFPVWKYLVLDADATLCAGGGSFNATVYLEQSGRTLECNGQTIDHHYGETDAADAPGMQTPYTYSVSDVTIHDCKIQNVGRWGMSLKRFFRGEQLDQPMIGHSNIVVDKVSFSHTGTGIFVGQNSAGFRIHDVVIDDAHTGIYLEAGSHGTWISDSVISHTRDREGISIDSSYSNLIERSVFFGNAENDAINLYKNCGETDGQVCTPGSEPGTYSVRRQHGADYNIIRNNEFYGNSVSVAWRQAKTYSLGWPIDGNGHCAGIDVLGRWRDHSAHNLLQGNRFYDGAGLTVKDGPNIVHGNQFLNGSGFGVVSENTLGDAPVPISGYIAENWFDRESRWNFWGPDLNALNIVNNRHQESASEAPGQGKCMVAQRQSSGPIDHSKGPKSPDPEPTPVGHNLGCEVGPSLTYGEYVGSAGLHAALF